MRTWRAIDEEPKLWPELENALVQAVLAGANPLLASFRTDGVGRLEPGNGVYTTDLSSGVVVIQKADDLLSPIVETYLKCPMLFLIEEVSKPGFLMHYRRQLVRSTYKKIAGIQQFFLPKFVGLRIVSDPCDGTICYSLGKSNWAVSIALIVDDYLAIGVIYEPVTGMIYCARFLSPKGSEAVAWRKNIHTGEVTILVKQQARRPLELAEAAIGCHLSRSNEADRKAFLPHFESLYQHALSVFLEMCGLVSLRQCATGELHAFINPGTHLWDCAAAIPLIVATTNGKVTQTNGNPITFNSGARTSVLAATTPELHAKLVELLSGSHPCPNAA